MKPLNRYCLALDLQDNPELIEEYKHWHKPENIWPEIPEGIKSVGIVNMEIYLLETRLFMIMDTAPGFDFERDMNILGKLPRQQEWEQFVSQFQQSLPGAASHEKWQLMEKIFTL